MSSTASARIVAPLLALALFACGGAPQKKSEAGGAGPDETGGSGGDGGSGGSSGGSGGSARPDAATLGESGGAGGSADAGPTSLPDAGSVDVVANGGDASAAAFTCNLLVGPSPMMQWFRGGFLDQPGIDAGKWEMIWVAHHYTDAWATPGDSGWNTPLDKGHACTANATAPDRVIFQATQWSHTTAAEWEKDLAGIVENIKKKWPGVKRIELMTSTSAPGNVPCPAAGGKNNETIVPAIGYQAIEAMPAKYPGLVFALPHFEVPCNDFIGNGTAPQYAPSATATTGPAVMDVAKIFGTYFAAHP
jgi:hypothetical protein